MCESFHSEIFRRSTERLSLKKKLKSSVNSTNPYGDTLTTLIRTSISLVALSRDLLR